MIVYDEEDKGMRMLAEFGDHAMKAELLKCVGNILIMYPEAATIETPKLLAKLRNRNPLRLETKNQTLEFLNVHTKPTLMWKFDKYGNLMVVER